MKLLRGAVLIVGFGVLGMLWIIEDALRRNDRAKTEATPDADRVNTVSVEPASTSVTRIRVLLGGVGVGIAVFGLYVVLRDVAPASYLGLAIWLVAAIALHDFVLVPILTLLRSAAHRAGRRLPPVAVRLVEAGFLVGGAITIIAVPEIYAKQLGTLNTTVLPSPYGLALLSTWLVLAVVTAFAVAAVVVRSRRRVLSVAHGSAL